MKITLGELKPNPFKKYILDGKLEQSKIDAIKQSAEKTSFWENWIVREVDGVYQLVFGHHRLKAAIQLFGVKHEVHIQLVKYSDEQMAVALANENAIQDRSYREKEDVVRLFRDNLRTGKFKCTSLVDGRLTSKRSAIANHECGSVNCILAALGDEVWKRTTLVDIFATIDALDETVKDMIGKSERCGKMKEHNTLPQTAAQAIATLPKEVQKKVANLIVGDNNIPKERVKAAVQEIKKTGADPVAVFKREREERDAEFLKDGNGEAARLERKCYTFLAEMKTKTVEELLACRDMLDKNQRKSLQAALLAVENAVARIGAEFSKPAPKQLKG